MYSNSVQAQEEDSESDSVERLSCTIHKDEYYLKLCSDSSMKHKLFLPAKDINDDTRHGHDIVCEFVRKRRDFLIRLKTRHSNISRKEFFGVLHDLESQIRNLRKDSCLKIPSCIAKFMKFVKQDPDKTFYGKYNWYYTGGCLQHVHTKKNHYLLFVDGKHRDNLCVAPLMSGPEWHVDNPNVQRVVACPGKEIFQVTGVRSSSQILIGTRQRHHCHVYLLQDCEQPLSECVTVDYEDGEVSFVSCDISGVHKELCTINSQLGLSFWDIQKIEEPMTTYYPSDNFKYDKWHSVWYSADPSVVTVTGRRSCKWLDRRSNGPNSSLNLSSLRDIRRDEEISVHFPSKRRSNLMYIGTNVNLFMIDIRSPGSPVHRWPHQLTLPPLYGSTISLPDEREIACIGNHYPGNVILAFSSSCDAYPLLEVPTCSDSLLSLQAHGLCLDPSIKPRMSGSLTGLTGLTSSRSSTVELLTQTIASDIFSQSLFEDSSNIDFCNLGGLATTKETLKATERWNMSKLYKRLAKDDLPTSVNLTSSNVNSNTRKQAWQMSEEELLEYKDVLSSVILAEWEVDSVGYQKPFISSEQKVTAWLGSNSFSNLNASFEG